MEDSLYTGYRKTKIYCPFLLAFEMWERKTRNYLEIEKECTGI